MDRVRELRVVVALLAGAMGSAAAQLTAPQQPAEKLLVLPFMAAAADSALSIAVSDAVRERIGQLAKYKVVVITKAKLCEAQKAFAIDPNSAGAHLCVATVYEAQRLPVDSNIAASQRALRGDSLNPTALENIARGYQQKGDTLKAIDAFIMQLRGEPRNTSRRLGIAQLLRQMKQYQRAVELLDEGLAVAPAAQQAPDTQAFLAFTAAAVRAFPNDQSFLKTRGAAFEMAGAVDSALAVYRRALVLAHGDASLSLL